MRLLERGDALRAFGIATALASSHDESEQLSGILCKGYIYEDGGAGFPPDLDKAIHYFREVAIAAPSTISFNNLARSFMKKGDFDGARKYLSEAARMELTPEVLLGLAEYNRRRPERDLSAARAYYLKAALRGRFNGFFGYSEVSREMGHHINAIIMDFMRIIFGPLIGLLLRSRALDRF